MNLAEGFVEHDAGGGGQVQAADLAGRHGNADHAVGELRRESRRQAFRFAAEEQAIAVPEVASGIGLLGRSFDAPDAATPLELLERDVSFQSTAGQ